MDDLNIVLDPASPLSLQHQLRQKLINAIHRGVLRPGRRLPSSRSLAERIRVGRNTVSLAYDALLAEGHGRGDRFGGEWMGFRGEWGKLMNALTIAMVVLLGLGSGRAIAGDVLKVPKPPKVSDVAKTAVLGAGNALLPKPCVAGNPKDGATGAGCSSVAGQMAASLANQAAPSAKKIGAIATQAAIGKATTTLAKPCAASAMTAGKTGSDICNEVAGQMIASVASQTVPSAKNVGTIVKVAMVGAAGATLSKPCASGTTTSGQVGSAVCKEVASQLATSLGSQTAPDAKSIRAGVQAAATNAVAASAGQNISKMLPGSQQPIVGDLLTLGLKRQLPAGADAIGTFSPPTNSALPMATEGLRTGLSIISNDKGKAGLGVKSNIEVGSKKFEISGSLDPNSDSDQGKSAGVQIKIGGN